jgi:hypothetical protein
MTISKVNVAPQPVVKTAAAQSVEPTTITTLKAAVLDLSRTATAGVGAVRTSFVQGVAPVQTVSSASVSTYIKGLTSGTVGKTLVGDSQNFGVAAASPSISIVKPPIPEFDTATVSTNKNIGVLDSFYIDLVISIDSSLLNKFQSIRILRAKNSDVAGAHMPSTSAIIDGMPSGGTRKSSDSIGLKSQQAANSGVGNKLTTFVKDDLFSKQRVVISSGNLNVLVSKVNSNRGQAATGLVTLSGADRSVLDNLTFSLNRRTVDPQPLPPVPLKTGNQQGINVLQGSSVTKGGGSVQQNNSAGFSEVARLASSGGRTVGSFSEFRFRDLAVVYGSSYTYYAVCHNGSVDGARSRIISVDVVRRIPPVAPMVTYGVVAGLPRFSIKCSGSFIDHVEIYRHGGAVPTTVRILGSQTAQVTDGQSVLQDNGFYHLGDLAAAVDKSVTYVDQAVTPGNSLGYRFYTVDSFGLKSSSPFSCSLDLPGHGQSIPLAVPNITAEQGAGGRVINVTVSCDDPRVKTVIIGRRDRSSHENSYRLPTAPDYFRGGRVGPKRAGSRSGPKLSQWSRNAWTGSRQLLSGSVKLTDTSVDFDQTYQYSVQGIDIHGNPTSAAPSELVFVASKPISDAPTAFKASVISGSDEAPTSVLLSWIGGTTDFSPNELIGDQDVLSATSIRSLFQVERRPVDEPFWKAMPATTESYFVDIISDDDAPLYRPNFATTGLDYYYRVIAMQSGGFVSTYTDPLRVSLIPSISSPSPVWIRSTPTAVRPLQVVISWNYDGTFVDGWQVERAAVNKVFGAKLTDLNSEAVTGLSYTRVANVKRESSRSVQLSSDTSTSLDRKVFIGDRYFIDPDISLANSYFYRMRAEDENGNVTAWVYVGIRLTDSPFDRKFFSTLSSDELVSLASDPRPITKWRNG